MQQQALVVLLRQQLVEQRLERLPVGPLRLLVRLLDQHLAFDQLERDIEPGIMLLHDLGAPALEQIAPGLDRVQ